MLQGVHSAIRLTFLKLPFVIKNFVLSIFEWPFYIDVTVFTQNGEIYRVTHLSITSTAKPCHPEDIYCLLL